MEEGEPVVSIVIAAHSVRREFERSLASIDEHAGMPVETIVVDNASEDDTAAWIAEHHPSVQVIRSERNEFGAGRNHALPRARGACTMFLDSDAALTPGALPELVGALERHPDWALVAPRLVYDDGGLQLSARRFPPRLLPILRRPPLDRFFEDGPTIRHHLMADEDLGRVRPVLYTISACHLFRTDVGRRAGLLDEALAYGWEDADWCIRLRDVGGEIVLYPKVSVIHSYRRLTRRAPVSRAAVKQLRCHVHFQRKYARRRRELIRLQRELDDRRLEP